MDEVDPNTNDKRGRTLLWWAVRNGHKGVVRILLERNDLNPNLCGKGGQDPLSLAVKLGHQEIVEILRERNDLYPDTSNIRTLTPLM